ncbi:hypothetical protein [Pontibacter ramchanderi]|uniref:hypothetical protein n=1 Tax=Pontibacter ramchanderi TaxID=1179743 RepID=UPI000C70FFD5|nr:hypothetical protein [Pontibacter ramchanderi]
MIQRQDKQPNRRLTSPCLRLQQPGQLVRRYHAGLANGLRSQSGESEAGDYSSPVCYAHLREFREGF